MMKSRPVQVPVVGMNGPSENHHHQQQSRSRSLRLLIFDIIAIVLVLGGLYWFAASFFLAKRSLEYTSSCYEAESLLQEQLGLSINEIKFLLDERILSQSTTTSNTSGNDETETLQQNEQPIRHSDGCWMDRRVDSMILLVVDALRFDFAYYNFPNSIGKRLQVSNMISLQQNRDDDAHDTVNHRNEEKVRSTSSTSYSRLYQFIADPPTVTMQRLKALTTGGLPTFADISGNFGGAKIPEDTWIRQLLQYTPYQSRGLQYTSKVGFVGDDTWEDLFPQLFTPSYPYPSFNTRDLDTVDNGCIRRIPTLFEQLRTHDTSDTELEVVIVHFLGVDHVGHTYGPHNEHMDTKLRQMDNVLSSILDRMDASDKCHTAFIMGDHGMTNDGNHGGGSMEETHAALFVHTSPSCGTMSDVATLEQYTSSSWVQETFATLHQIDLVPVISILLGLPIPYANMGGLIPSILPGLNIQQMTAALALNAAQIWRYLTVYSETANRLPDLESLQERLHVATLSYKDAIRQENELGISLNDGDLYIQTAGLYKTFLTEALILGQRVWTRFDDVGMISGIIILLLGLLLYGKPLFEMSNKQRQSYNVPLSQIWEIIGAIAFIFFTCGILSFSNSYIYEEKGILMYSIAVLCCIIVVRMESDTVRTSIRRGILVLPILSRIHELFISGHGMDPSVRLHIAHNAILFLSSLFILGMIRWSLYENRITSSFRHMVADCAAIFAFGMSWWEKRSTDQYRNGYIYSRIGLLLIVGGFFIGIIKQLLRSKNSTATLALHDWTITYLVKVLIGIMAVTGPSAAPSLVIYTLQAIVVYCISLQTGTIQVNSYVVAALWRFVTRHMFFATNHGCYFNRLQYSAAFIATKEFYFVTGGISLFLNTFGWEMVGIALAWLMSQRPGRATIWRAYSMYQIIEALASCISVGILRRHLMVWDIYAPHFLFAGIYTVLHMLSQLTVHALS